jgi:hypothetical protein
MSERKGRRYATLGQAAAASLLTLLVAAIGCRDRTPRAQPDAEQLPPTPQSAAWIKADPNPVPVAGDKGTTNISWDTRTSAMAQVYMLTEGKPEQLFAGGARGSQKASWINKGRRYEFILYAGKEHQHELARVTVTTQ